MGYLDTTMDSITGMNRGFAALPEGILQLLLQNNPNANNALKNYVAAQDADYAKSVENSPIATRVGYVGGILGGSKTLPLPTSLGSSPLAKVASIPTLGAAQAGLQYVPEGGDRASNMVLGAGLNSLASAVPATISAGANYFKDWKNTAKPSISLANQQLATLPAESIDDAIKAAKDAKDLGTHLGIQEATKSPLLKTQLESLPPNLEYAKQASSALTAQEYALKQAFDKALGKEHFGNSSASTLLQNAKLLYSKSGTEPISQDVLTGLKQNPFLASKLENISSLGDLKLVYHDIKSMARGSADAAEARNLLKSALYESSDNFRAADQMFKYASNLKSIENKVDLNNNNLKQIYTKLFSNPQKRAEFYNNLDAMGGDLESMRKFENVLSHIDQSSLNNYLRNVGRASNSVNKGVSTGMRNLTQGAFNRKILDMATNGQWLDDFLAANKTGTAQEFLAKSIPKSNNILNEGLKSFMLMTPSTGRKPEQFGEINDQ